MNLHSCESISDVLRHVLTERKNGRPQYSLRAFARDIDLSPSRLSEIMNGRGHISREKAYRVAEKLQLPTRERMYFMDLLARATEDDPLAKQIISERLTLYREQTEINQLPKDNFSSINAWYNLAILEVIRLTDFQSDPLWIARKLGISEPEVKRALVRLQNLDLITVSPEGEIALKLQDNYIESASPCASIRSYHRQILAKAFDAVEGQTLKERNLFAYTVAIDQSRYEEFRNRFIALRSEFTTELNNASDKPDAVYCLSTQFFRITSSESEVEKAPNTVEQN